MMMLSEELLHELELFNNSKNTNNNNNNTTTSSDSTITTDTNNNNTTTSSASTITTDTNRNNTDAATTDTVVVVSSQPTTTATTIVEDDRPHPTILTGSGGCVPFVMSKLIKGFRKSELDDAIETAYQVALHDRSKQTGAYNNYSISATTTSSTMIDKTMFGCPTAEWYTHHVVYQALKNRIKKAVASATDASPPAKNTTTRTVDFFYLKKVKIDNNNHTQLHGLLTMSPESFLVYGCLNPSFETKTFPGFEPFDNDNQHAVAIIKKRIHCVNLIDKHGKKHITLPVKHILKRNNCRKNNKNNSDTSKREGYLRKIHKVYRLVSYRTNI